MPGEESKKQISKQNTEAKVNRKADDNTKARVHRKAKGRTKVKVDSKVKTNTNMKPSRQEQLPSDIPECVYKVYERAYLQFSAEEKHRIVKKCESQIGKLEHRIGRKRGQDPRQILADMQPLHKQAACVGYTVCTRYENLKDRYQRMLYRLIRLDISFLGRMAHNAVAAEIVEMEETAVLLRRKSLYEIYKEDYMQYLVGQRIEELMGAEPEKQYPEARGMNRQFILHIGPTNSGKTYDALKRLRQAYHGIYLGPLRLLALEVYDTMTNSGIPCDMVTGEETIRTKGSFVQASTVEILDLRETYDIAVIDEAQMVADENRGSCWTRAILGIKAQEIHVCCSITAEELLKKMIRRCGDRYTVVQHERNTPLEFIPRRYDFGRDVERGDALIAFSKKNVLAIAAALEKRGIHASVIYGNLPPQTRQEQVRLFSEGIHEVVVATDAIGMGINLPIRRIVFMNTIKFDGTNKRRLRAEEIRQIAGRAGRYGYYDVGYVQTVMDVEYVGAKLKEPFYPLKKARIGFPEPLLDIDLEMDEIIEAWEKTKNLPMYDKISMAESIKKYRYLKQSRKKYSYMDDRKFVLSLITCPFDVNDRDVLRLWLSYCKDPERERACPMLPRDFSLEGIESYYKQLDLYMQFSARKNWQIDRDEVVANREWAQHEIGKLLKEDKEQFEKKCRVCGRSLSWDYPYPVCEECYVN